MAIIYSYPITNPQDSDLFIISRTPDDPDEISNFSVGVGTIADYIIDKLIDPNAFDFQIPVFNQSGTRITGSIMSQDSSPSNGVAGTKITIAGNTTITGDVQIDTLNNDFIPVNREPGVLRDSVIYQDYYGGFSDPRDKAVALNTLKTGTTYGEYPDLRVASRSLNDPGVLDLFRPDGDVQAGDRVGILQYSLDDDNLYAVAQIEVKTISQAGTGNSGGGKLCIKTSTNLSGAQPTERICIDNTGADFSVPINVTDLNRSSFAGQVTIPLTPVQNTDAASKGYVDSQLDKDLQIEGDTGTGSINLDTQVFDVAGGTYIDTAAGGQTITVDISAVDGNPGVNERYLTKNNTWAEVATIPGTYVWSFQGDLGTPYTVNSGSTVDFAGSDYITTSTTGGNTLVITHDDTNLVLTNSTLSPGAGGSFSVIDSVDTNLQGHVTEINTLTVTLPQDTDNYVDGGTYSSGTLTLERTGSLADIDISGFLEIGTSATQALAGNTTTITQTQADDIIANNAKVSFPEAPTDGQQYARQNSSWSVVSGGGGGGTVTGTGTTNTLPVWSDGPNGVLGDSGIRELRNGSGDIDSVFITTSVATSPLNVTFGTGGATSFKQDTTEFIRLTDDPGGFYTASFRYVSKLTVDRANASNNPSLDVGDADHTYPAAWFRNGVVISNNPSGVQVDNTSMVIGAGNNDNVSGSDHCLIVGSGNQITSNSDRSVAFGQGNAITSSIDAFTVGNSNTLTSSLRTQSIGFNNTVTAASSFIAGGGNSVTASSNIFVLGDGHTVTTTGSTQDAYLLGTSNTITGGTGSFAIGSNLDGDTGNHMVIGYRNNKSSYPATDYSLGLGNTKFALAVGSTTTTNSNALLITEGGVNRGGGVAQVPRIVLPTIGGFSATDDTAAAAIGIPLGGLYQSNGDLRINTGSTVINEGSWTPTITAVGASNFSWNPIAGGANVGYYIIQGNIMTAWFTIPGTANWAGTGGFPLISGLPYAFDNTLSSAPILSADFSKTQGLSAQAIGVANGPSNTSLGITVLVNNNYTNMGLNGTGIVNGIFFSLEGCVRYKLL